MPGWVEGLTGGRVYDGSLSKGELSDVEVTGWLLSHGGGEPCPAVVETVDRYITTRLVGGAASRHDAARDAVARLVFMAVEGHTGAVAAIYRIGVAFRTAISGERERGADSGEWQRLYVGAVRLAAPTLAADEPRAPDPCTVPLPELVDLSGELGASPEDRALAAARAAIDAELRRQRAVRAARLILDDEDAARKFRVPPSTLSLVDELARPDLPVRFRIEKVMPADGNTVLTAAYKTGKTTLINHLARCLADGEDFLGRFAVQPPSGRIALLNYEVSREQYARWLREVEIANLDKVTTLPLRGYRLALTTARDQAWLVAWLTEREVSTLIVDPFARAFAGLNENDNSEVGRFLDCLDEVKSRAGIGEMIVATHTGRAEFEVGAERARGATRLDDWPDVRWMLTKDENGERYFSATGRDVEVAEFQLNYLSNSRALAANGKGGRVEMKVEGLAARIRAYVETNPGVGITTLARALNRKDADVRSTVNDLVADRLIRVEDEARNKRALYPLGPSQIEKDRVFGDHDD